MDLFLWGVGICCIALSACVSIDTVGKGVHPVGFVLYVRRLRVKVVNRVTMIQIISNSQTVPKLSCQ